METKLEVIIHCVLIITKDVGVGKRTLTKVSGNCCKLRRDNILRVKYVFHQFPEQYYVLFK